MVDEEFSKDAAAAFDKLAALKRRYQQESDPVPELLEPVRIDHDDMDHEDIPVLTEVVLLQESVVESPMADESGIEVFLEFDATAETDVVLDDVYEAAAEEVDSEPEAELLAPLFETEPEPELASAQAEATPLPESAVDPVAGVDQAILNALIERLRPEIETLVVQTVADALVGNGMAIYEAWVAGLQQRAKLPLARRATDKQFWDEMENGTPSQSE